MQPVHFVLGASEGIGSALPRRLAAVARVWCSVSATGGLLRVRGR